MRNAVIFIILIIEILTGKSVLAQNDQLEPTNSLFSIYDYQFDYYSKVRKVLFKGLNDNPEIRFLVLPSFTPENVLDIEYNRQTEKYLIIYRICDKMIWHNDKLGKAKIVEYKKDIDKESVELIKDLFGIAISNAKYLEELNRHKDGEDYYFTVNRFGQETAMVWSPPKGTKMERLVSICFNLIDLVKDDNEFQLKENLKQDIINLTNELK